jgi:hypothetical protein
MDGGVGQHKCCGSALQNVRRQRDVRRTVWAISEQPNNAVPTAYRKLASHTMHNRPRCEERCQFIRIPQYGRILEQGLELLR